MYQGAQQAFLHISSGKWHRAGLLGGESKAERDSKESPRHNEIQDRFGIVNKAELVAKTQDLMSLFDALKLCKFLLHGGVKVTHYSN